VIINRGEVSISPRRMPALLVEIGVAHTAEETPTAAERFCGYNASAIAGNRRQTGKAALLARYL